MEKPSLLRRLRRALWFATAGLAILAAPFTLGVIADQFDLVTAFTVMVVLNLLALALTLAVRHDDTAAKRRP